MNASIISVEIESIKSRATSFTTCLLLLLHFVVWVADHYRAPDWVACVGSVSSAIKHEWNTEIPDRFIDIHNDNDDSSWANKMSYAYNSKIMQIIDAIIKLKSFNVKEYACDSIRYTIIILYKSSISEFIGEFKMH